MQDKQSNREMVQLRNAETLSFAIETDGRLQTNNTALPAGADQDCQVFLNGVIYGISAPQLCAGLRTDGIDYMTRLEEFCIISSMRRT